MFDYLQLFLLAVAGLAIGFVGGLVGLVLGVIRLPLILGTELSAPIAAGTNIGVSTLGALAAAIQHLRQNNIHRKIFFVMATTGAGGAFLGSQITRLVPVTILLVVVAAIVIYESFMMLRSSRTDNVEHIPKPSILTESLIGFEVGFVGGLVGLVLGSIRLPAMISVLKMEPKVAIGTNLAAATIMGTSGLVGHIFDNSVDYYVLAAMGPSAVVGAVLGARFTNRFNARTLKLLIGITLVPVAAFILLRVFLIIST